MKILVVEDEPKAAEYMRQGLTESGCTVEVALNGTDGRSTPPPPLADRLLVRRAITNPVSNAIRHALERSTIIIHVVSTGRDTTLSVTNEGEHIAPANLQRVFERFFREDQGRARGEGGGGLGLAIAPRAGVGGERGGANDIHSVIPC